MDKKSFEEFKSFLVQKRKDNMAEMETATDESEWQIEARTLLLNELLSDIELKFKKEEGKTE
jgi:hypothetical protein